MSDNNETPRERKPLGLKRSVESGEVKQTFSHGRTNKVTVEVKRRRTLVKPGEAAPPPPPPVAAPPPPPPAPAPVVAQPAPKRVSAPAGETPQERVARLQREAEEDRLRQAEEARKREDEAARLAAESEKKRAEDNRRAQEEAANAPEVAPEAADAGEPAGDPAPETEATPTAESAAPAVPAARRFTPVARPEPKKPEKKREEKPKRGTAPADPADKKYSGKLTVNRALNEDEGRRARSLAALKRAREKERRLHGGGSQQVREKQVRDVIVPEAITVGELAKRMGEKGAHLVKELFANFDMMVTVNQTIDQDTAELLVESFGHNIQRVSASDVDIAHDVDQDPEDTLRPRPPVVAVMGHVDHGKTSLLDALRKTNVTRGEAGGITQHIGAYQVTTKDKSKVTFLDTPGHAAFTEMRQRGANVTDIVVLVVAADDGIMPQTIEAIKHAKAAGVPLIVAINKIDKPEANAQKVRERLLEHEVVVEAMSGDVQDVEVSAKTGAGLDDLIEKIALQAELLELKARPDRDAEATVIEAQLDKGRGPVATVLINRGTLKRGDNFVVGTQSGKVRALVDDQGKQIAEAGPSMPVEVLGLGGVPSAGDRLTVVENEQRAREVAAYRQELATEQRTALAPTNFDTMFNKSNVIEWPVVVKADVQGSVQAIVSALHNLSNDDIKVRVLNAGVGAITESDVVLANASKAPIIGFNVRPNAKARELVKRDGVRMMYHDVIYHLTDEVTKELLGELGPLRVENVLGRAEVKDVFKSGKRDKAAGLLVVEGVIRKGLHARLTRADVIVSATTIASLRRFKDDVDEVRAGLECGVVLSDTNDIKPGDQLEVFEVNEEVRTL
ncbi:MAG: translation initiation factor IF-2 [Erythrobacter sp.]|nr:MAG: translation initiation factor IF-2 [Erythrobacter sp.]